ncbi:MAG TPA: S8 family serine peptidase [Gemmatimonadaceae bacterium]|nr:S8 family serine peptidase [Gemmatimonadaceae bacterium]
MKQHLVVKLYKRLRDDDDIPDWLDFIHDKSFVKERLVPDFDRVMRDAGAKFWVVSEHKPAGEYWTDDEVRHGLDRVYRVILQDDYDLPPDLVARIRLVPGVEGIHDLAVGEADIPTRPTDGDGGDGGTHRGLAIESSLPMGRAEEMIGLAYARAITRGQPEVHIAVLDTGVNLDHQELEGKLLPGADFVDLEGLDTTGFIGDFMGYDDVPEDEVGHGTHVSGIIAARGVAMDEGVAPDCRIMPVRVLATMKSGDRLVGAGIIDNINTGIKWAVDHGAHVINMSLGIRHAGGGLPHEDVIRYALTKNVTVVAASGNDGTAERYYPGALPGVIAVGAVDPSGVVTPFTSYGAPITVVAPGTNIYSSFAHNTYAVASGTSQAAPFVTGAVALLHAFARQAGRRIGFREVTQVLRNTADRGDAQLRTERAGYGLINLADALKLLAHQFN